MLTEREKADVHNWRGLPDERIRSLLHALRNERDDAIDARIAAVAAGNTHMAAMFGGKAKAYSEAVQMIEQVRAGGSLHPRAYSKARARARAYQERLQRRRILRKMAQKGQEAGLLDPYDGPMPRFREDGVDQ